MSPMAQLYVRNAKKVECASAFPPTAISVTVRISKIVPKDSAVLIYTPPLADRPIRFNGPETKADVPVEGHEMYYQAILGCRDFQLDFLGWTDKTFR
jgi:hypothetical protein